MVKKLLLIEDNPDISHLIGLHLRDKNMQVEHEIKGDAGLERALSDKFDMIILDLMLPGIDGMEVCRTLRKRGMYTPVLMLTAKNSELDRVLGLEVGADDYLTKPFSVAELVARVNALLRRVDVYGPGQESKTAATLAFGDITVDPDKRQVLIKEQMVELTAKEFDLLWHFASHPGKVYTRNQLLDSVWGYCHAGYEHTVNSHINRLRSKIEKDPAKPRYVLTVWGVGYKFADLGSLGVER